MAKRKRSVPRRILRELGRPIERLGRVIRSMVRAMVIDKNESEAKERLSIDADSLLLAFLRSAKRHETQAPTTPVPAFALTMVEPGRILSPHPLADFFYCAAEDLRTVGLLAGGRFEEKLTDHLQYEIAPGDSVGILGDFSGYHTLSASSLVQDDGRVFLLEDYATDGARSNVDANLRRNATVCDRQVDETLLQLLDWGIVRIGVNPVSDSSAWKDVILQAPQARWIVFVADGERGTQSAKDDALELASYLAERGFAITQEGSVIDSDNMLSDLDWNLPCQLTLVHEVALSAKAA